MDQAADAVPGPSLSDSEETRVRAELLPPERDDFPLEQSWDEMLRNAYESPHHRRTASPA